MNTLNEATIKERINTFCKKYPEPIQYAMKINWSNKSGCKSAIVGNEAKPLKANAYHKTIFSRNVGKPITIQNYRFDEDTQLFECAYSVMKCTTVKPNENRKWEYKERYFIPKGSKVIYDENGDLVLNFVCRSSSAVFTTCDVRHFFQIFTRLNCHYDDFQKAFAKLTDNNPDLPPRYIRNDYYPWVMTEWIVHKPVKHNPNSKTNKKIASIIDNTTGLEPIDKVVEKIIIYKNNKYKKEPTAFYYGYSCCDSYVYFDKSNNVFRIIKIDRDGVASEINRVYIDNKNKPTTVKFENGKWISNGSFCRTQFNKPIINMEDVVSVPRWEYIKEFENCSRQYYTRLYQLIQIFRNPEIEQLIKMGCKNMGVSIGSNEQIKKTLGIYLGETESKSKNVCKKYRLTANQIRVINDSDTFKSEYLYNSNAMKRLYTFLGTDNLSSIDVDTFRTYYTIASQMSSWAWNSICNTVPEQYKKTLFVRLANMSTTHPNVVQLYCDLHNTYRNISEANRPDINIYGIKRYEDIVRTHDVLMQIKLVEDEERRRLWNMKEEERNKALEKKMEKIDEERIKLNFEDENYLIRIPISLGEITTEGSILRHCVGGYLQSHANGSTTILFLRQKSAPNTPFYTIEVRQGKVIQIHGFGNKWLGNDEDAIPTVMRWLKANNISCATNILCSTAKGYSAGNAAMVELPKI